MRVFGICIMVISIFVLFLAGLADPVFDFGVSNTPDDIALGKQDWGVKEWEEHATAMLIRGIGYTSLVFGLIFLCLGIYNNIRERPESDAKPEPR